MRVVSSNHADTYQRGPTTAESRIDQLFRAKLASDLRSHFSVPSEPLPARMSEMIRRLEERVSTRA
jgi:hypothetical protein